MVIQSVWTKLIIAILLFLINTYFCDTDSNSKIHENNIITDIIPSCVFGVESVSYYLYTREKPYGEEVRLQDEYIPLRANKKVVFLIHGFISEANNSNYFDLVGVWLKKEDINIFSLDWSNAACSDGFSLSDLLAYNSAVNNIHVVSEHLTNFTIKLVNEYGMNVRQTLIVGHSLGAHVAGIAGKAVQEILYQKYQQIIGLDPAGPNFKNKDCTERLCKSDAAFVQVFHTSSLVGFYDAIGDYDFYFNGGDKQPGCILPVCSHTRAVIYFTMSLLHSPCFIATPWKIGFENILSLTHCNLNICIYPGLDVSGQTIGGTYYVNTTSTEPYCTLLT
ncbi:phospholipase A1-like [Megachile rotundata]|uniref:phospholipase A1-like n=1 Tax=Megachile rotundata TaxID=143995 RepID=UPI003FD65D0E